ncbi:MAG TPA: ATP-grasp domain-containing protein, partial [Chitinophagales bacterium]|nr:ATP-grasp domain-containing protein [Chitinophagales bacterium]
MNIHEYQAKSVLSQYGVATQKGIVAESPEEAVKAAKQLSQETGTKLWVIKAQIHAGGRGKGTIKGKDQHGVALAKSTEDVERIADNILGGTLVTIQTGPEGRKVKKVLIAEDVYYPGESELREFYFSILLDRSKECNVIMYSTEGGVDIEDVAEKTPDKIFKEWIDPCIGIQGFQARRIAFNLGLTGAAFKSMVQIVPKLYQAYEQSDASMLEINPLLKTTDDKIIAVDCKFDV